MAKLCLSCATKSAKQYPLLCSQFVAGWSLDARNATTVQYLAGVLNWFENERMCSKSHPAHFLTSQKLGRNVYSPGELAFFALLLISLAHYTHCKQCACVMGFPLS